MSLKSLKSFCSPIFHSQSLAIPVFAALIASSSVPASATVVINRLIGEGDFFQPPPAPFDVAISTLNGIDASPDGTQYITRARFGTTFNYSGFDYLLDQTADETLWRAEGSISSGGTTYDVFGYENTSGALAKINASGQVGYRAQVNVSGGPSDVSSIWVDDTVFAVEGNAVAGQPGFTFSSSLLFKSIDSSGNPYYRATYSNGGTTKRGLVGGVNGAIVMLESGDTIGGVGTTVDNGSFVFNNFDTSDSGSHYIAEAETGGLETIVVNDAAIPYKGGTFFQENTLLDATDGGNGVLAFVGFGGNATKFAVNDSGDWVTTVSISDPVSLTDPTFDALLVNGQMVVAEGLPGLNGGDGSGTSFSGSILSVDINNDGDIAYILDAGADTGVYVNGERIIDGTEALDNVMASLTDIRVGLSLSDRAIDGTYYVYFGGTDNTPDTDYTYYQAFIPEPTALAMLAVGSLLVGSRRRR